MYCMHVSTLYVKIERVLLCPQNNFHLFVESWEQVSLLTLRMHRSTIFLFSPSARERKVGASVSDTVVTQSLLPTPSDLWGLNTIFSKH